MTESKLKKFIVLLLFALFVGFLVLSIISAEIYNVKNIYNKHDYIEFILELSYLLLK
jgi:hypothetical protein